MTKATTPTPKAAPAAKVNPDAITYAKNVAGGGSFAVGTATQSFTIKNALQPKEFIALCGIGNSYAKAKAAAEVLIAAAKIAAPGKLARGLDNWNAPHSVKAIRDNKAAAEKDAPKATAAKPAAAKNEEHKVARAAKAPKGDDARKLAILKKDFAFGRENTSRRQSWDVALKVATVADYIAKGGAAKYLPRWAVAGAVKLG